MTYFLNKFEWTQSNFYNPLVIFLALSVSVKRGRFQRWFSILMHVPPPPFRVPRPPAPPPDWLLQKHLVPKEPVSPGSVSNLLAARIYIFS